MVRGGRASLADWVCGRVGQYCVWNANAAVSGSITSVIERKKLSWTVPSDDCLCEKHMCVCVCFSCANEDSVWIGWHSAVKGLPGNPGSRTLAHPSPESLPFLFR